jgi:ribosome biogenesis GTPase A
MVHIHWYPGHIAKAERKLREQLSLVDIVIEIIDARIPYSSKYIEIKKLLGDKPRLLIMNKSDLAEQKETQKWIEFWKKQDNCTVVSTSASTAKDLSNIVGLAVNLGQEKMEKLKAKGLLPRPVRAMVVGMPNVGKSSIINKLIKKTKAKTGAIAGVTRQQQWVRINPKVELLDTPGIIPMKLEDQEAACKLAFVSSISENAYDKEEVSQELLNVVYGMYKEVLLENYKLEDKGIAPTLEDVAMARSWRMANEKPDLLRAASHILSDFRKGRLGRMTLDKIEEIQN